MKKRILAIGAILALVVVLVVPAVALAADDPDTEVSGDISAELELTAPGDIDLPPLVVPLDTSFN